MSSNHDAVETLVLAGWAATWPRVGGGNIGGFTQGIGAHRAAALGLPASFVIPHLVVRELEVAAVVRFKSGGPRVAVAAVAKQRHFGLGEAELVENVAGLLESRLTAADHGETGHDELIDTRVDGRVGMHRAKVARLCDDGEPLAPIECRPEACEWSGGPVPRAGIRPDRFGCLADDPTASHRSLGVGANVQDEGGLTAGDQMHAKRGQHTTGRRFEPHVRVARPRVRHCADTTPHAVDRNVEIGTGRSGRSRACCQDRSLFLDGEPIEGSGSQAAGIRRTHLHSLLGDRLA